MSQRKGLADLFIALKTLNTNHVSLTIIGRPSLSLSFYKSKFDNFDHIVSCTNEEVKNIMRKHDILVLPSIVEGCALVQQEALSCGLPLIITPNTGGEDFIEPGKTGFLVPIRKPNQIAEKIEWFIRNKNNILKMRNACIEKSKNYTWKMYAEKIINNCLD